MSWEGAVTGKAPPSPGFLVMLSMPRTAFGLQDDSALEKGCYGAGAIVMKERKTAIFFQPIRGDKTEAAAKSRAPVYGAYWGR